MSICPFFMGDVLHLSCSRCFLSDPYVVIGLLMDEREFTVQAMSVQGIAVRDLGLLSCCRK